MEPGGLSLKITMEIIFRRATQTLYFRLERKQVKSIAFIAKCQFFQYKICLRLLPKFGWILGEKKQKR